MPRRLLLGPQRPILNLKDAVQKADVPDGPIAVISAGWQEAEGDIDDVREVVGRELVDLGLYHRAETLFENDALLRAAYRARQDRLVELQRLNRLRLKQLMIAAREALRAEGDESLISAERRHAVSQLRALDRHHYQRICQIHSTFDREFSVDAYAPLAEAVDPVRSILIDCPTVLITGGNIAVLANRMRLFDAGPMLEDKHLIAWSAGAMVLTERIVLYHDRTPLVRRDAELFGPGLNLLPGFVFLPDAKRRLRKSDEVRMALFSRRFSPDACVTLDSGTALLFENDRVVSVDSAKRLTRTGKFARVRRS